MRGTSARSATTNVRMKRKRFMRKPSRFRTTAPKGNGGTERCAIDSSGDAPGRDDNSSSRDVARIATTLRDARARARTRPAPRVLDRGLELLRQHHQLLLAAPGRSLELIEVHAATHFLAAVAAAGPAHHVLLAAP